MMILVSHLSFRRYHKAADLPVRMPLFPYMQIAGLVMLAAILITMGLDTEFFYVSWLVGVPWVIFISAAYFVWKAKHRAPLAREAIP
jgi:AAT family amino acid transporter